MLSSPSYGALCTKYRALIAEMQKWKRPILCYSEFRAKALVGQTITMYKYINIYIFIFIYAYSCMCNNWKNCAVRVIDAIKQSNILRY